MSLQLKFGRMIAVLVFGLAIGQSMSANAAEITMLPVPVQPQTHLSRLTTDANGQLWLSWVASTESRSALHYARLKDGQWSESRQIAAGSLQYRLKILEYALCLNLNIINNQLSGRGIKTNLTGRIKKRTNTHCL